MASDSVAVAAVAAPWGPVHVAASETAVVGLEVLATREGFVARLERRLHRKVGSGTNALLDAAVAQLEEYLDGGRRAFDLPIELADRPGWDRSVLDAVHRIPWGTVSSYGAIARAIDRPGAARAVGGAVGRNPIGLVIPCHRVIAGDGSLGGYGGDWSGTREQMLEIKRELLAHEGVLIARG